MTPAQIVACAALAVVCVMIEWHRDAMHRSARVAAAIAVALLLGTLATSRQQATPLVDRVVIGSGGAREASYAEVEARVARLAPGGAVRIEGDGLGVDALALLRGHPIEWDQPSNPVGLARLSWPRRAVAGERITIAGELDSRDSSWVALHHPDGHADSVRTDSAFAFTAAPRVPGMMTWTIDAGGGRETIGVQVRPAPTLLVVLVEGQPGRDGAALARLVVAQGGGLLQRTRVTARDDRITTWGTASPVRILTDSLLARTDALVLGPGGLATLSRAERDAVARQLPRGLGVVHLVDSVLTRSPIFPFTVVRRGGGNDPVRVAMDSLHASRVAIPAAALSISGGTPLLSSVAGAPVAWLSEMGEGALVATRITAPSRWALAGDESSEAAWWAALMGAVLRSERAEWRVPTLALARVDHPLSIERAGVSADNAVLDDGGTVSDVILHVGSDTLHRRITLWPRDTGWMSIATGGDTLRVHVAPRKAFASLDRANRRRATGDAVASAASSAPPGTKSATGFRLPPWLTWTLSVATLALLWIPSVPSARDS